MKIDFAELQKIFGQVGVAAFIGGLLDGIVADGFLSAFLLGGIGIIAIFFSVMRGKS